MNKVFRVLYIEENVNEKAASQILQDSTRLISEKIGLFMFFVVPNAIRALELVEQTVFDVIIVQEFVNNIINLLDEIFFFILWYDISIYNFCHIN
jgi:hypothetical protein